MKQPAEPNEARDERMIELLDAALEDHRRGRIIDASAWQARFPDLSDELPGLLETVRDLACAADGWRLIVAGHDRAAQGIPPQEPLPEQLGRYRILARLGEGGMGAVYKAIDPQMDRLVALKVPHFHGPASQRQTTAQRFLREARAAARLLHPNIVTAFDVHEAEGAPFLVMEYIEGQDLGQLVNQQGPIDVELACRYVLQAARGLEYAHRHGIIHRDIKPANLLVDRQGAVKILDLGLARFAGGGASEALDGSKREELTHSGQIMGTADYMAPEQALNTRLADGRADIYSLGCTLFRLLTARAPFGGETGMEKLLAHREQPLPRLREYRPEVPDAVEAIFQRMAAKRPDDRYPSMTELIADLESCLGVSSTSVRSSTAVIESHRESKLARGAGEPRSPTRRRIVLLAGATALLFAGGVSYWQSRTVTIPAPHAAVTTAATEPSPAPLWQPTAEQQAFLDAIARLPAEEQAAAVSKKLSEVNPDVDTKLIPKIESGAVVEVSFLTDAVTELWPVRALSELTVLRCRRSSAERKGKLSDLSPLAGMPLRLLDCEFTHVADLSPLRGMPLTHLICGNTDITSLSPLAAMPLTHLACNATGISDLSPLAGMPLTDLICYRTGVTDLSPLTGMPLTALNCSRTGVADLSPLAGMRLTGLICFNTLVSDLSPLAGMPLGKLCVADTGVSDLMPLVGLGLSVKELSVSVPLFHEPDEKLVRSLGTLRLLSSKEIPRRAPATFWQEYEARRQAAEAFALATGRIAPDEQAKAIAARLRETNGNVEMGFEPLIREGSIDEATLTLPEAAEDITPLRALTSLKKLTIAGGPLGLDLSPLNATPLEELTCREPIARRNAHVLRSMPTLTTINSRPVTAK